MLVTGEETLMIPPQSSPTCPWLINVSVYTRVWRVGVSETQRVRVNERMRVIVKERAYVSVVLLQCG